MFVRILYVWVWLSKHIHMYLLGSFVEPFLPLGVFHNMTNLPHTRFSGMYSWFQMNSRNLKSSSFTSGQYLYTSVGILSGPVGFEFFSCLTVFSNSDLSIYLSIYFDLYIYLYFFLLSTLSLSLLSVYIFSLHFSICVCVSLCVSLYLSACPLLLILPL